MSEPHAPPQSDLEATAAPPPRPPPLYSQRSWSPDVFRDEAWVRRKGNWKKKRRSKSVTDDDVDELKGCIELGFGFGSTRETQADPRLSDTIPALGLYYVVNKNYNESLISKSTVSTASFSSTASDCHSIPSPIGSPHNAIFARGNMIMIMIIKS